MFDNDENEKEDKNEKKKTPVSQQFVSNILSAILIFMVIIVAYSFLSDNKKDVAEIPLSELATQISQGKVSTIVVEGDKLNIKTVDGEEKISKRRRKRHFPRHSQIMALPPNSLPW